MKMNWGIGIAIGYSIFAIAMTTMAVVSTQYDHSLVREDYYQADLAYQKQYDNMVNEQTNLLSVQYQSKARGIAVQTIAKEPGALSGKILFFRPNDKSLDFTVPLQLDATGQQWIPTDALAGGRWTLKMDYQSGEKGYYSETQIVL
jgi:nitrogen fixation protein FixH